MSSGSSSDSDGRHSSRDSSPTSDSSALAALQSSASSSHSHGEDRSRSRSPHRGNVTPAGLSDSDTSSDESSLDGTSRDPFPRERPPMLNGTPRQQRHVKISHILIKHKDSRHPTDTHDMPVTRTKDQAMKMMSDIHQMIVKDLITFADAAVTYSECMSARRQGDVQKQFQENRVQKNFEDAVFVLGPGEVSEVIESKSGYHILQRRE